jgi:hypothetical protein
MKNTSHQSQLKQTVLQEFRKQQKEEPVVQSRKQIPLVGLFSFTGGLTALAIVAVFLVGTFSQPTVVTAEELLADALGAFDAITQLQDDELFEIQIRRLDDAGGTGNPSLTYDQFETVWTDGEVFRRDQFAPDGELIQSTLMVRDSAKNGRIYTFQKEYAYKSPSLDTSGEGLSFDQPRQVIVEPFSDYPDSGSIVDLDHNILMGFPIGASQDDMQDYIQQTFNTNFTIAGEEEMDGVWSYRLEGTKPAMEDSSETKHQFWIAHDDHRLLRHRTALKDGAVYDSLYGYAGDYKGVGVVSLQQWQEQLGVTDEELSSAQEYPERRLSQ